MAKQNKATGKPPISTCQFCATSIAWLQTKGGKPMPVNTIGSLSAIRIYNPALHISHYNVCKEAQAVRHAKQLPSSGVGT